MGLGDWDVVLGGFGWGSGKGPMVRMVRTLSKICCKYIYIYIYIYIEHLSQVCQTPVANL